MEAVDEMLQRERPALLALAYRMLGTVADAEDAVQETFVRWYRLSEEEQESILSPGAWLMRAAGRICLDMLGSARARRELYVGEWLPEPLPAHAPFVRGRPDPLDRVAWDETISTALLLVLETLTPAERVVFVLHEAFAFPFGEIAEVVGRSPGACRQLASSARRHVREGRSSPVSRERHDALVQAFAAACASGEVDAVVAVLDSRVVLRSDGGGVVSAARRPVRGVRDVARFVLGLMDKWPDAIVSPVLTPDGIALTAAQGGAVTALVGIGAGEEGITDLWIMRNPHKLRLWQATPARDDRLAAPLTSVPGTAPASFGGRAPRRGRPSLDAKDYV